MPSDAHELAARLRNDDGDIGADMLAAAVELERLADENARLSEALERAVSFAARYAHQSGINTPESIRATLLSSAGPPQEVSPDLAHSTAGAGGAHPPSALPRGGELTITSEDGEAAPLDPAPERRCTTLPRLARGEVLPGCEDPACPEHGTERRCTCEVIHDPTLDRLGRKRVDRWGRADPACPVHG